MSDDKVPGLPPFEVEVRRFVGGPADGHMGEVPPPGTVPLILRFGGRRPGDLYGEYRHAEDGTMRWTGVSLSKEEVVMLAREAAEEGGAIAVHADSRKYGQG